MGGVSFAGWKMAAETLFYTLPVALFCPQQDRGSCKKKTPFACQYKMKIS
jgi:hypothetical protein